MILIQLTNGFGNNIFQYTAAKLLADFHKQEIYALPPSGDYYAISDLEDLGVSFYKGPQNLGPMIRGNDSNYRSLFNKSYSKSDIFLNGYFEDYTYYENEIKKIKSWFPPVKKRADKDLVIHFRAGDRLFYKNEFDTKPTVESYLEAIDNFEFERLHIVTDMPRWKKITIKDLENMSFHRKVEEKDCVPPEKSIEYFNSFVEGFAKFTPLTEKRTVGEDFNFIRSFDNILFQHGTLGWWASALSDASKVGVYGPWRPWKGNSNKNLGKTPLRGWFQWG